MLILKLTRSHDDEPIADPNKEPAAEPEYIYIFADKISAFYPYVHQRWIETEKRMISDPVETAIQLVGDGSDTILVKESIEHIIELLVQATASSSSARILSIIPEGTYEQSF